MTNERAHEAPDIRNSILRLLKQERTASIAQLADRLRITYEAVRQHIVQMERDGWVDRRIQRRGVRRVGRPTASYSLTPSGDHLFPKSYDTLASELLESVEDRLGDTALEAVLSQVAETQVARLEPVMRGRSLPQRLEALRGFYTSNDPFMELESLPDGNYRLIEQNCPFLNVAADHPMICGTTVLAFQRLLGFEIEREESFQQGNRRCVFLVRTDRPFDPASTGVQFQDTSE